MNSRRCVPHHSKIGETLSFFTRFILSLLLFFALSCGDALWGQSDGLDFSAEWKHSSLSDASQWFELHGTGDRNNPIRRSLDQPFRGNEFFVRFRLRYAAEAIDTPANGNGEFFVCWLDERDGGDTAGHSSGVPNFGVHVDRDRNAWMARFDSARQEFAAEPFKGDQDFVLLGRLSKSKVFNDEEEVALFDQLDVWINPGITDLNEPDITCRTKKSIREVKWIGFATGRKTEAADRIAVSDVALHASWTSAFGLPALVTNSEAVKQTEDEPSADRAPSLETVSFSKQILPLLRQHCFDCHAGEDPDSGIRLDSYDELLNQLTPRNSLDSHLVRLLRTDDESARMPPQEDGRQRLTDAEMQAICTWIDEGVSWDFDALPTPVPHSEHWAFQPIRNVTVPIVSDEDAVRTPVDAFIIHKQQPAGVTSVGTANWSTLRRRIALDLTGLPPSEFRFLERAESHDQLDDAIDRLLETDAFGERWGRHWLDVARWAESNGYQHNRFRPNAWQYRDYVVQSFKQDTPYDQFIREQLAGDQLAAQLLASSAGSDGKTAEAIIATGFLAAARYSGNELDKEIQRNDILVDITNATSRAFLGITMECAQCHTHKFDPFTIRDYYRLQAFFSDGQPANVVVQPRSELLQQLVETRSQLFHSVKARLVKAKRDAGAPQPILIIPKSVVAGMTAHERKSFRQLEAAISEFPQTWGWAGAESGFPVAPHEMRWPLPWNPEERRRASTYLRLRGDVKSVGPEVEAGWPMVFGGAPADAGGRIDLANWIASPKNPLTARVWVNRIWQWHFGRGIVETSADFGTEGSRPSHPELLDWLASELIRSGWRSRHIHRLIMRSNTYRQASFSQEENESADPANRTWWRWMPRRLESEAVRDSALAIAGVLDRSVGGPSVPVKSTEPSSRRSIYLRHERQRIPEDLALFDSPPALTACSRRMTSTVALQPLYLLNSPQMQLVSQQFADRVREIADEETAYGSTAFKLALGREADRDEEDMLRSFLADSSLELLCQSLLNLNEFVYLP